MSWSCLLILLFISSAFALDSGFILEHTSENQIQPKGVITPSPNCSAVGAFNRFEINDCTKFPCDVKNTTRMDLFFTPSRNASVQARIILSKCGTLMSPIYGNPIPVTTDLYRVYFQNLHVFSNITDGPYNMKIEVVTLDNPVQTQARISGNINWKAKGGTAFTCAGSGVTSVSILFLITLTLVAIWKVM
jgi:hypothetical protein